MTRQQRSAIILGITITALIASGTPASATPTPAPEAALIYVTARPESGCNVATLAFGTEPEEAPVTVERSIDNGPWQPQPSADRVRFEHHPGAHTVQWAVTLNGHRTITNLAELHQCATPSPEPSTPAPSARPTSSSSPQPSPPAPQPSPPAPHTSPTTTPHTSPAPAKERAGGLPKTGA